MVGRNQGVSRTARPAEVTGKAESVGKGAVLVVGMELETAVGIVDGRVGVPVGRYFNPGLIGRTPTFAEPASMRVHAVEGPGQRKRRTDRCNLQIGRRGHVVAERGVYAGGVGGEGIPSE